MSNKLGCGEIQFQGCLLGSAVAICLCHHAPPHVPDRDAILAYLHKQGVDPDSDFSLILDADGNQDTLLVFGNTKTFTTFQTLVYTLASLTDSRSAGTAELSRLREALEYIFDNDKDCACDCDDEWCCRLQGDVFCGRCIARAALNRKG